MEVKAEMLPSLSAHIWDSSLTFCSLMSTTTNTGAIQRSPLPRCGFHAHQISQLTAKSFTLVPKDVAGPLLFRVSDPSCYAPKQEDGSFIAPAFNKLNTPARCDRDSKRCAPITDLDVVNHVLNHSQSSRFISTTPVFLWAALQMKKWKSDIRHPVITMLLAGEIPEESTFFALGHIDPEDNQTAYNFANLSQEVLIFERIPASAHLATFTFDQIESLLCQHAQWISLKDSHFDWYGKQRLQSFQYYARDWCQRFHYSHSENYPNRHVQAVADIVVALFEAEQDELRSARANGIQAFAFHLLEWPYRAEPKFNISRYHLDPTHVNILKNKLDILWPVSSISFIANAVPFRYYVVSFCLRIMANRIFIGTRRTCRTTRPSTIWEICLTLLA
jgi:hypothetical protein